ncbi:MAG TPA: DUF1501 domain-containing protein [Verrucomicrobiae bacterium]|nr:DUF1501 domain-containing protein [Verrucomicrobiae bacterium]
MNRRDFLGRFGLGLGGAAVAGLWNGAGTAAASVNATGLAPSPYRGQPEFPNFPARARRVIYLFMSGGPSQMDLFDYKPALNRMNGQELPSSVRQGQRLTGMSANQSSLPLAGSVFQFKQHGRCGAWVSELLPYTAQIVDELCFIRSLHTEAINHDPAITFLQTGSQQAGRPSMGSWLSYGLGSANENLPAFVVLISRNASSDQPLYSRLWGNGFLPSLHQGVQFRAGKDPVLYLNNPPGLTAEGRRRQLDGLAELHHLQFRDLGEPEIEQRVAQYEMAYRMQTSVPDVLDISGESTRTFELYGPEARQPGTFAANCLLARRLAERDLRFIQLYHQGWDHHGALPKSIRNECAKTDRACAALVIDLKERGLLDDTLVIWGGEFGRTAYSQGKLSQGDYGRDHHPRCFTMWMAGGGFKPGLSYGETDDFSYNVVADPVHVHDFQATVLHQLGIDHEKLTFRHQGRRYRLTDVHGELVRAILA